MHDRMYPLPSKEFSDHRRELAPEVAKAFHDFSKAAFADGALPRKLKQLIAVAVAHTTQCVYCIDAHVKGAKKAGASREEIVETSFLAAALRAGGAAAHGTLALRLYDEA